MLTKQKILDLFVAMNEELKKRGINGEVGIVGGAAMALAFNARVSTRDIDAIFAPSSEIRDVVKKIAGEMNLPDDWLNDAVKGFFSQVSSEKIELINHSHLRVWMPAPEYLLAMKAMSARFDTFDKEDICFLIKHLKLSSAEDVLKIVQKYYPKEKVSPKTQFFVEEIFDVTG